MSTRISWQFYLTASLVILAVYYTALFLLYYRKRIFPLANNAAPGKNNYAEIFPESSPASDPAAINLSAIVQNSLDELQALILQAASEKAGRQTLLNLIGHCLKKYPGITDPALRSSINNLIAESVVEHCSIHFTKEELGGQW